MRNQLNIRNIPEDVLKRAKIISIQQDRNLSDVIRELLKEYVEKNEKKVEQKHAK